MKVLFVSIECELLSIEYLSAVLQSRGHSTYLLIDPKLFDTELFSCKSLARVFNYEKIILNKADAVDPDLICFSVCADNNGWAVRLATLLKRHRDTPIIFGGIHPTIVPEKVILYPCVDYVCIGEGEWALADLADALEHHKNDTTIPNIIAKKRGRVFSNPPRLLNDDLDALPFPDKEMYFQAYPRFLEGYKITTSRGCPYTCSYCANHQLSKIYEGKGDWYRRRSVENVIEELKRAKKRYPVKMVRFFDEVFTLDKQWFKTFVHRYKKEINVPYFCFTHPNHCDKDTVRLLEESGCATVFMGFGTYFEHTRKLIGRNYSNQKVAEIIGHFKRSKIYLVIDFILGFPAQNKREAESMAYFFNEHRPDVLSALFLRYYPNTEITRLAHQSGLLSDRQLSSLSETTFKGRIIIEKKLYRWFTRIQFLMLISKYLPKRLVKWLLRSRCYCLLPPVDWNNLSVIVDSVFPKMRGKRRVHTDTVSPFQFLHFYFVHMKIRAGFFLTFFFTRLRDVLVVPAKKFFLIYKLGLRRMSSRKLLLTLSYLFKTKILKRDCPGAVIIGVTNRCQCKCVHCSVGYVSVEKEMAVSHMMDLLNQIAGCGIPKVNFFGGEPLILNKVLVSLVRHAYKKGLSASIDSNGILLEYTLLKELKDAGINNINVSMDSADASIHDELRGVAGTFDRVVEALKLCVGMKIPCVISTYSSKRSIHTGDLEKIIALGRQLRVSAVKVLFPLMSGKWSNNTSEMLSRQEKRMVYALLDPGFVYLESPLYSIKDSRKVCESLDKNMVYVSPQGDVQLCYTVPVTFGNVTNDRLEAIIRRMWKSEFFQSIGNTHDCVMNNPFFREKFIGIIDRAERLPINYENIKNV